MTFPARLSKYIASQNFKSITAFTSSYMVKDSDHPSKYLIFCQVFKKSVSVKFCAIRIYDVPVIYTVYLLWAKFKPVKVYNGLRSRTTALIVNIILILK